MHHSIGYMRLVTPPFRCFYEIKLKTRHCCLLLAIFVCLDQHNLFWYHQDPYTNRSKVVHREAKMHAHIDSVTGEMTLNFKCVVFVLGCRCRKVGAAAKDGKTVTTETDRGLSPRSICQLFHCWWWSVHLVERIKPPGLRRCFAQRLLRLRSGLSTDLFTVLGVVAAISAGGIIHWFEGIALDQIASAPQTSLG